MAKKGCVFRNYEYLITVLGDSCSTCVCLPLKNVTTFTHTAAKPELKCNSSSVIYFQLVSQKLFLSVAANIGQCVHTRQHFRFQGWGIRVWIFFFQAIQRAALPIISASSHLSRPYLSGSSDSPTGVNVSLYGCRSLQFIDGVSVDRNSRVSSDVHMLTQAKSC